MNRTPLAAAAALALAACSFAPRYQRPDAGVPEQHRFAPPAKDAASLADLPWWEAFRDPVLQGLIREALANNQDLALAASRVDEARAFAGIAKADYWPQVAAFASGQYGQLFSKEVAPGAEKTGLYGLSASVSWEIDLWGRVRNQSAAAVADLVATEYGRQAVVLALVSGVAQSYLDLRSLDLELEIAKANTATRKGTLDLFQSRARGGIASDLEVNQARADLAFTSSAIPATERLIAVKEHELSVLLGKAPGPIDRGVPLVSTPIPPEMPAGVPAQLLERRPDVLAAEQGIVAAGKRVGVAVANRFPQLSLAGLIGLEAREASNVFTANALLWNAGGSLLAPIFQGGRLKASEEAARAQLEQSFAAYRKSVEVALREVADAAVGVQKLRLVRIEQQVQVTATMEAARLALLRYQGGVSSYLEVLDAQRQQYDAELSLARTRRDELTSVVQLYRALGGGWGREEAGPEAAKPAEGGGPPPSKG